MARLKERVEGGHAGALAESSAWNRARDEYGQSEEYNLNFKGSHGLDY